MKKTIFRIFCFSTLLLFLFSGTALAGWERDDKGWWWKNADGSWPHEEWKKIDGKWYYFHQDGYMAYYTWVGDYFVGDDGAMLTNSITPDGYHVDASGKRYGSPDDKIMEGEFNEYNKKYVDEIGYGISRYLDYYTFNGIIDVKHAWKCDTFLCDNPRIPDSMYCEKHTCMEEGCFKEVYSYNLCIEHFSWEKAAKQLHGTKKQSSGGSSGSSSGSKKKSSSSSGSSSSYSSSSSSSSSSSGSGSRKNYYDSYDEGYEDIWLNDDYDDDRYRRDSDYAAGVDDAMDEFEWDG